MIGGGAFNLPQNMARGASLGAVIIAWILTLLGMFFLANAFRTLADKRPDLKAGIYRYAQEGFGPLAGFEMAWGYWLSSAFGNVAFAVLLMQILGYFFPVFGDGRNWPSIVGGSVLIWAMHFIVLSGVKRAAGLNVFSSFVNIATIGIFLVIVALFIRGGQFSVDVWGQQEKLGSVFTQVKSTMLVTLWVFLGIEAAVVVSDRAKNPAQVGTATFVGLTVCSVLYFLLSVLPFGVMHQSELAGLSSPSSAYVLQDLVGGWGAIFVNVSLLFSELFCWLAWTILVAELPYEGAKGGVFPKFLARTNRRDAPAAALWISSIVMQITMFVVLFAHDAWIWLISITGVTSLPPYVTSTAFLLLYASKPGYQASASETRSITIWTGFLGTLYSLWLLYAAGLEFVLMSTIVYAAGLPVFWYAQKQRAPDRPAFTRLEMVAGGALVIVSITAVVLFSKGIVRIT
jgi:arginine:ornithine antiporter/lysine permease